MPLQLFQTYTLLPAFLLVLFRMMGLVMAAPVFGSAVIPFRMKALLTFSMTLAVFPLAMPYLNAPVTLGTVLAGLLGEVAIGVFIGLCVSLIFVGIQLAGEVISYQAGLALGEIFNPLLDTSSTASTQLYFLVATLIFILADGDTALITTLMDSFAIVPPLTFRVNEGVTVQIVNMLDISFQMAIRVGGPAILALMLGFLTLGFLSRTVPQLNILTVGFPIKLALALFIMAMTIMGLEHVLLDGMETCFEHVREGLRLAAMK